MAKLLKEANPNVPTVEAPKQENSNQTAVKSSLVEPPVLQIDLTQLDPNMLKMAESMHIPLGAILKYVADLQMYNASVEARLRAILENFEPAVQRTVNKMVEDARNKAAAAPAPQIAAPTATGLGGMLPQLLQMAGPLLGNVAASDPFTEMAKQQFLANATMSQNFMNTFMQNIMGKLGSKVATEVVDSIPVVVKP